MKIRFYNFNSAEVYDTDKMPTLSKIIADKMKHHAGPPNGYLLLLQELTKNYKGKAIMQAPGAPGDFNVPRGDLAKTVQDPHHGLVYSANLFLESAFSINGLIPTPGTYTDNIVRQKYPNAFEGSKTPWGRIIGPDDSNITNAVCGAIGAGFLTVQDVIRDCPKAQEVARRYGYRLDALPAAPAPAAHGPSASPPPITHARYQERANITPWEYNGDCKEDAFQVKAIEKVTDEATLTKLKSISGNKSPGPFYKIEGKNFEGKDRGIYYDVFTKPCTAYSKYKVDQNMPDSKNLGYVERKMFEKINEYAPKFGEIGEEC